MLFTNATFVPTEMTRIIEAQSKAKKEQLLQKKQQQQQQKADNSSSSSKDAE